MLNYIREAENRLWYYRDLQRSVDEMSQRIGKLISKAGPADLSAMVLDGSGVHSQRVDDTLNILFEIQKLTELRKETKEALSEIDSVLTRINGEPDCKFYGTVLRMWYIERIPKEDIAEKIGYSSRRSVYQIRARAIRKFAVMLFGIEALKVV